MDISQFYSKEYLPALTWLGRRDWLRYGADDNFFVKIRPNPTVRPNDEERKTQKPEFWQKVDSCIQTASNDHIKGMWMYKLSRLLAYGPKIFCPTGDDCLAAEHMKVGMRFEEYRQPYEVVIIEVPPAYQQHLKAELKLQAAPQYVVPFYNPDKMFISVSAFFANNNIITNMIPARPEYKTLQDCFDMNRDKHTYQADTLSNREFQAAEIVQKMAINFCLLMTLKGIRHDGPVDRRTVEKAEKLIRSKREMDVRLGKSLLLGKVDRILMHQDIKIYAAEIDGRSVTSEELREAQATGRVMPVHYRTGHHRMQHYGPRNLYSYRLYVPAVWVNINRYEGPPIDPSKTSVKYTLKDMQPEPPAQTQDNPEKQAS